MSNVHKIKIEIRGLTKEQHDRLVKLAEQDLTPMDLVGHIQAALGEAMKGGGAVAKMKQPPPG